VVSLVGVTNDANFQMVKKDDLIKTYNINVVSNLYFIQLLSKILIRQCTGSILFVSSISALDGNEGQLSYSCSKGALVSATKTLSKELGSKNIRVNCIAPGVINTTMNEVVPKNIIEDKVSITSLKRIGQPIEVASTIYFLLSEESSFITGQVIRIDGGM
jgi:3-oxoacyl-[acyl-carrier protein] reductase